ncbi:MAG: M20 family metallopeptidase [Anaerolineae bacterium]|nr:M20 family metallopeptidase [Anaerolineae bacterium]MDW8069443.1 M20 family metallopeptidase [Anaerolineae bacterium]
MSDWLDFFARRMDVALNLLRELVEMESPSTDKAAVDRVVRYVAERARAAGAEVAVIPQERWGDHLLARWGQGEGGFLLLCHLDTVWPVGTLTERPWRVEGERAFGPGIYDDKASAAIILTVLEGLQAMGFPPRYPITVLFNSDEEVGSPSSRPLIEAEAARARVVFCMEPARPDGALKVWRKGTGQYTVTALGRAAHAGADHEKGINAIEELAYQVLRLQRMTDYGAGTTINVGRIEGGTRTNVVPERAQVRVDVRVKTIAEWERISAAIEALTPVLPGARLVVEGRINRPPMEASPLTLEPFRRAQKIAARMGLALTADGTGGASDANFTAAMGVPTLDGLGARGDGAHSGDEYIFIPSLAERAALLATLLIEW